MEVGVNIRLLTQQYSSWEIWGNFSAPWYHNTLISLNQGISYIDYVPVTLQAVWMAVVEDKSGPSPAAYGSKAANEHLGLRLGLKKEG